MGYETGQVTYGKTSVALDKSNGNKPGSINYFNEGNWGVLRHSLKTNPFEWGADEYQNWRTTSNLKITASGKNVDIIILEVGGFVNKNLIEFNSKADGTGTTRVKDFNWFSLHEQAGNTSNITNNGELNNFYYNDWYSDRFNRDWHPNTVAAVAAGNSQGYARDANIYSLRMNFFLPNIFKYVKAFHQNKPINPLTGRRNPTIVNGSFHLNLLRRAETVTKINFRGTITNYRGTYGTGDYATEEDLKSVGIHAWTVTSSRNPNQVGKVLFYGGGYIQKTEQRTYPNGRVSTVSSIINRKQKEDIAEMINAGVIFIQGAGNNNVKISKPGDIDYDNYVEAEYRYSGNVSVVQTLRMYYNRGDINQQECGHLIVGGLENNKDENKAGFSSAGSLVDIYAASRSVLSTSTSGSLERVPHKHFVNPPNVQRPWDRAEKAQGTSFGCPLVTGAVALAAEHWPTLTQQEVNTYFVSQSQEVMADSGTNDGTRDFKSLYGGTGRVMYWENIRGTEGYAFPRSNYKLRQRTGILYPRPRARRRG